MVSKNAKPLNLNQKRKQKKLNKQYERLVTKSKLGDYVLTFGKHKGKALKEIDLAYLKWCVKNLSNGSPKKRIKNYLSWLAEKRK
jgi:uncharacterized protein (DUF3820 family)